MIPPQAENTEMARGLFQEKIQEEKIKRAFEIFRASGIEPILIKGWAAARPYTRRFERIYSDIDLCVDPDSFEKARALAEQESVKRLNVDLHRGFRHLDTISWDDLYKNSRLAALEDTLVRILRPEDHLRILCVHWLNDGGAHKERLLDVFYAVENRPDDFDWKRCLSVVSEKRRRWIVCVIGLTRIYFGLSIKNTPLETEVEDVPGWLIRAVEKEWQSKVRLKPLLTCLHDRKQFVEQIRKRLPPNPIQATIESEGSFDRGPRIFYQTATLLVRTIPLLKEVRRLWSRRFNQQNT